jgi:hypothetical protein
VCYGKCRSSMRNHADRSNYDGPSAAPVLSSDSRAAAERGAFEWRLATIRAGLKNRSAKLSIGELSSISRIRNDFCNWLFPSLRPSRLPKRKTREKSRASSEKSRHGMARCTRPRIFPAGTAVQSSTRTSRQGPVRGRSSMKALDLVTLTAAAVHPG